MRLATASSLIALMALGWIGCGSGRSPSSALTRSSAATTPTRAGEEPAAAAQSRASRARPARLQPNYDTDDETLLGSGRSGRPADARAIDALVERYYTAAARGDGAAACAMTSPDYARTVPDDYGQELGWAIPPGAEAYLRGAKTCAAVLSLLFAHLHRQLAAPVEILAVRLYGNYGYASVGSTTLPASRIEILREHGVWWIDELLGRPLP
jgi:hypothetical protein